MPSASRLVWPRALTIVRHGQSAGNAARDAAEAEGLAEIAIATRDVDVPLSPLGERQARALGEHLAKLDRDARPDVVFASPYVRAHRTAAIALEASGFELPITLDERLREREFGWIDALTRRGIEERFPLEAKRRARLGKFYHRPPGGESWCDVILRVRSFVGSLREEHGDARVLVVAHQVGVLAFRYVVEAMTEEQILAVDAEADVANCAITSYERDATTGHLALRLFNHAAPVRDAGEAVTRTPDVPGGTR